MSCAANPTTTVPARVDYLILGNSAAGVTAAEAIRFCDKEGSVAIASPEPYPVYGRPLISYMIEGKTTRDRMGYKDPDFYDRLNITTLLGEGFDATTIDADAHTVTFSNEATVEYGSCLVATGSVPFTPPIEGLNDKANICTFMTLDDANRAEELAQEAAKRAQEEGRESHAVVIGAGLIGLKAAEAVKHIVDRVTVLELAERILPAVLDGDAARMLQAMLAERGIECHPGVSANKILGDEYATGAELTNGETISCDFVIAAVGVRPNTGFVVEAGAEQGRGLVCGTDLQTSLPDVYAAGDVVQVTDVLNGAQRPLALWPNAVHQGRLAGLHMAHFPHAIPYVGSFAVNAVDFFDASLLTSGIINPPADDPSYEVEIQQDVESNSYAKFVKRDGCLVGYILFNRPDNAGIYTAMIENKIPLSEIDEEAFAAAPANLDFPQKMRWDRLHPLYPSSRDQLGRVHA